jgi:transcription antitermination protein NusB
VLPVARREARERALSLLYEAESKGISADAVIAELPVKPDAFATGLVLGVGSDQARIDSLISSHAIGWAMERMPVVDRALLRMATYELLAHEDVPTAVVISEAVDLATQYSTDESGRFVNGVLAAIATDVRGEPVPSLESIHPADPADPADPVESVDSVDRADRADRADPPSA